MSLLARLHSYLDGQTILSQSFDDEFNQLVVSFGSVIAGVSPSRIIINGLTDAENDGILETRVATGGIPLAIYTASLTTFINTNGQLKFGTPGDGEIIVASRIKCPNLNADSLGITGQDSTTLQIALYSFTSHYVNYPDNTASTNPKKSTWICPVGGGKITKLKLKQDGVASADANTTITFLKNGVSIGTVSIAGNVTAVQINDIVDVDILEDDLLTTSVTTYTGTTKHTDITAQFDIKKKFKV